MKKRFHKRRFAIPKKIDGKAATAQVKELYGPRKSRTEGERSKPDAEQASGSIDG